MQRVKTKEVYLKINKCSLKLLLAHPYITFCHILLNIVSSLSTKVYENRNEQMGYFEKHCSGFE